MLVGHTVKSGTLFLRFCCQLDVTSRAAAVLDVQDLLYGHRPSRVVVELLPYDPSPATLSAVLRTQRLCAALGIPFDRPAVPTCMAAGEQGSRAVHAEGRRVRHDLPGST